MKYVSFLFYVLSALVIINSGCKKTEVSNANANTNSIESSSNQEGGYSCDPGTSDSIDVVEYLYNEEDLAIFLASGVKQNVRLYFVPDAQGEFIITGSFFPGSTGNVFEDFVAVFSGFRNLELMTNLTATGGVRTNILYRPNGVVHFNSNSFNRRLFVFRDCQDVHIRELNMFFDAVPGQDNIFPVAYDIHSYDGLIAVEGAHGLETGEKACVNFLINDCIIKGTSPDISYTGQDPVIDLPYSTAIYVGVKLTENYEHDTPLSDGEKHTDICIVGNDIYNFRNAGINVNQTIRAHVLNNNIEYIWERADKYASQGGGIHIRRITNSVISGNDIHSVFSFWPGTNPGDISYSERFQHGIYISNANNNVEVSNNTVEYVSGTGIKLGFNPTFELHANDPNRYVTIEGNMIKFAYNYGIFVQPSENISVLSNHVYHCLYKMKLTYFKTADESQIFKGDMGLIHITEATQDSGPGGSADRVIGLVCRYNIIKNSVAEMYDPTHNVLYGTTHATSFHSSLLYVQYHDNSHAVNIISDNEICLESYTGTDLCNDDLLFTYLITTAPTLPHLFTYSDLNTHGPSWGSTYPTDDDVTLLRYLSSSGNCGGNVAACP